jgi:malonate transporter and related proteins
MLILNALVPIFAGLLLGYVAGRRGLIDNKDIRSLVALAMNIAVPCALVPKRRGCSPAVLGYCGAGRNDFRLSCSCTRRAITRHWFDYCFSSHTSASRSPAQFEWRSDLLPHSFASLLRAVVRPVVWAPLLAPTCVALNLNFPSYLRGTLLMLVNAAAGSALILTGVVVSAQRFRLEGSVLVASLAKLLLQPVLALGVTMLLHMSQHQIRDIMAISAIPGGFFGLVFGSSFKATPEVASSSLIASYALGWITLSMWLVVSARLS